MNEDLNANCTLLSGLKHEVYYPATLGRYSYDIEPMETAVKKLALR